MFYFCGESNKHSRCNESITLAVVSVCSRIFLRTNLFTLSAVLLGKGKYSINMHWLTKRNNWDSWRELMSHFPFLIKSKSRSVSNWRSLKPNVLFDLCKTTFDGWISSCLQTINSIHKKKTFTQRKSWFTSAFTAVKNFACTVFASVWPFCAHDAACYQQFGVHVNKKSSIDSHFNSWRFSVRIDGTTT